MPRLSLPTGSQQHVCRSLLFIGMVLTLLMSASAAALAADVELNLEAQLVWGSNDKPTDTSLKPVAPAILKKLQGLPFKWEHYYVMSLKTFSVGSEPKQVALSKDCEIAVKNLGGERVELSLIGKGKPVGKITQSLQGGHTLVTGGNAENLTGWFIVLRQAD